MSKPQEGYLKCIGGVCHAAVPCLKTALAALSSMANCDWMSVAVDVPDKNDDG